MSLEDRPRCGRPFAIRIGEKARECCPHFTLWSRTLRKGERTVAGKRKNQGREEKAIAGIEPFRRTYRAPFLNEPPGLMTNASPIAWWRGDGISKPPTRIPACSRCWKIGSPVLLGAGRTYRGYIMRFLTVLVNEFPPV